MILHNYLSNLGRDLIYEYINSLPEAEKIDGYTVLQHMEKGEFDKILFKRWEKKVYEVYFQKNNRVFYITVDKENIYLLHSCRKLPYSAYDSERAERFSGEYSFKTAVRPMYYPFR